jgi:hypothetical protein
VRLEDRVELTLVVVEVLVVTVLHSLSHTQQQLTLYFFM